MPELPEVEVTRRGLTPVIGQCVASAVVRNPAMRWPIPEHLPTTLQGRTLTALHRRAKYILAEFTHPQHSTGTLLLHLGMSGRLCLLEHATPAEKHDHFDIQFQDARVIRLRDPRRFGAVLWLEDPVHAHPLLAALGPEPLSEAFNGDYLFNALRTKSAAIKTTLMDAHVVVGVGNIYASESLFRAGLSPMTPSKRLSLAQCNRLVSEIQSTLEQALQAGGSSLRDFFGADGNPGYFQQTYFVYGRTGEPCRVCETPIQTIRQGQRSTFFCPRCQPA